MPEGALPAATKLEPQAPGHLNRSRAHKARAANQEGVHVDDAALPELVETDSEGDHTNHVNQSQANDHSCHCSGDGVGPGFSTWDAAEFLDATDVMGTVEAGKYADLVLLDANPVESAGRLHRIAGVVRGGRYYGPADRGYEATIRRRMEELKRKKGEA